MGKIRVLVVDDSLVARSLIIDGLNAHPNIEVIGYAINALDARQKLTRLKPDVMTCDVQMPGMSGIDFLKEILPQYPVPTVLVSSLNLRVFDALHAGAVDFVRKPDGNESREQFVRSLVAKVVIASRATVRGARAPQENAAVAAPPALKLSANARFIVGLGASTGGTEATLEVMKRLPADIPGMVIVQHMPTGFTKMYAERLERMCSMEVREARNGDEIKPGLALVAPADLQCRVQRTPAGGYFVSCVPGEKVSGHRPSVDALFDSMAENVRCQMVGIILTGMGADGAKGLLKMRQKGAFTIGQDEKTSVVYGMPGVAKKIGAVCEQAPCDGVAGVLLRHLRSRGGQ